MLAVPEVLFKPFCYLCYLSIFIEMKARYFLIPLILIIAGANVYAQPFFQWHDSIMVRVGGTYIQNPWAGGLNFVQTSSIDMNMDGKKDLMVFDRSGNKIRTFINNGTTGTVDYTYDPYFETRFPNLWEWVLLVDYNGDGKEDIFSYTKVGGGVDVYKNISTVSTGLQFQLVKTQIRSVYNPPSTTTINLYVSSPDIPAITDIDNDGDIDIVTFAITGSYMEYHKNMSMETYGTADSLKFQMANRCWGYASENALSNSYTLHDSCFGNVSGAEYVPDPELTRSAERHAGSCELCLDLDADGDKEFIVGDISYNNLTMLTNGGSPTNSNFVAKDTAFPENTSSTIPVDLTLFPCAYYVDVNYDNVKDLIVSPNAPNASENFNSVVYYKNNGTNNAPVFQYQQSNLLQDQMIEVGEGAYPVFFDYDSDGLKDLFIGNYGYYAAAGFQRQIAQFKNIGTSTSPRYDLITRNWMNLSSLNIINMIPAFGDLDGDGDADMVIGAYDGRLHYFTNTASSGAPANFVLTEANFKNANSRPIDVGDYAAPQIFDVNGDGMNDLVIGAKNGKFAYYRHVGSGSTALLSMDSVTHYLGNIKVNMPGYIFGYSYPMMFRQGGITKLISGADNGYLRYYDQIDGNLTGTFHLIDSTYLGIWQGTRTAPNGADINADGLMDLIVGNYEGGVSFYKGVSMITTADNIENFIDFNFELFPNPANASLNLHLISDLNEEYIIEFFNTLGQKIITIPVNGNFIAVNTENLSNGIYICKVSKAMNGKVISGSLTRKVLIRH
jgi:hypothetical protein